MMVTKNSNSKLVEPQGNLRGNFEMLFETGTNWTLETETKYYILLSIIFIYLGITYGKLIYFRRQRYSEKISLHRVLPRVKWTAFNLSWLDGFITVGKVRNDGMHIFDYLAGEYGQLFTGYFATQQFVAVSDPNVIKTLLQSTNTGHLSKHKLMSDLIYPGVMRDGLALMEQPVWSVHRKSISRAFTYASFPKFFHIIDTATRSFVSSAFAEATANGGFMENQQMIPMLDHLLTQITAKIVMGPAAFDISAGERDEFYNAFRIAKEIIVYRLLYPALLIPIVWMFHNKRRELDAKLITMSKIANKVIKISRENACASNNMSQSDSSYVIQHECLVDVMIQSGHTDSEIETQVIHFLFVGYETAIAALNFLNFHLAGNPVH